MSIDAAIAQLLADAPISAASRETAEIALTDFYAHMPSHTYLYVPTRELWPASSVNGRLPRVSQASTGKQLSPSAWLDKHRPIEQLAWHPGKPALICDQVMLESGWISHVGAKAFNLYRPPDANVGDATKAEPWRNHLRRLYPADAEHLERWFAHRVQRPGEKINHAIVLGGAPGIGKDTILEPIKYGVGPWNWQDVTPVQMLGRFNGWAKGVVLRVNEARDLGDTDRFAFYDHSKVFMAAPPDVIRVDEKNLREHYVANVCGVVITTNHKSDGLYLPADDRRHYVAWSEATSDDFSAESWHELYSWYERGGAGHVAAHLRQLDLSGFDPKAPPPKTAAFWAIVHSGEAPEAGELRDVLDHLRKPPVVTLNKLIDGANAVGLNDLSFELSDRSKRRSVSHKLERVGYVPVRNPDAADGLFKVLGRRQAVYADRTLDLPTQLRHARLIR